MKELVTKRGSYIRGIFLHKKTSTLATQPCACLLYVHGEVFPLFVTMVYTISIQNQLKIQMLALTGHTSLYYLSPPVNSVIIWALAGVSLRLLGCKPEFAGLRGFERGEKRKSRRKELLDIKQVVLLKAF